MAEQLELDLPEQPSYLEMSDEEAMNMASPSEAVVAEPKQEEEEEVTPDTENQEVTADADEEATDQVADESAEAIENKEEVTADEAEEDQIDFQSEYKRLLTPFKANGREIAVNSVDDAIALMQMGANYNKKMAALKPNLKLMKLLENNGMLSEEKLSFLIDLEKKNPDAINKLIKDSGVDPLDLDAEKAGEYKQTTYTVDDRELELDAVLDDIQGTPTYSRTLDVVSSKWDGASKQVIAGTPQLLKVINSHMQSGIYDQIAKEVDNERMFGRLTGLSDIEAYRQVGDAIQARGGFTGLQGQTQIPTPKSVVVQPKPKMADEEKLREKKRAASSTKPAGSNQTSQDYNPLSLSDDAFSKLINDKYL